MTAEELFGVCLRTIGVVVLLYGHWYIAFGVAQTIDRETNNRNDRVPTRTLLGVGAATALIGLLLTLQASWLAGLLY